MNETSIWKYVSIETSFIDTLKKKLKKGNLPSEIRFFPCIVTTAGLLETGRLGLVAND